jgi:hypothetical protein
VGAVRSSVEHLYPDMTVVRLSEQQARQVRPVERLTHVVRLKLARSHIHALQTSRDYQDSFTEGLLTDMAKVPGPAVVQLCLTPVPRVIERRARRQLKKHERGLRAEGQSDEVEPGPDSQLEQADVKSAMDAQAKGLHYAEIRVAATNASAARELAGSFGAVRAHNELVVRYTRLRRRLYLRRIDRGLSNPLPAWRRGILSAAELAYLWQAPRMRAKHTGTPRATLRRAPASTSICRTPELAIARDEHGSVGIWEEDRRYGYIMIGGQGMGKTSAMARAFVNDCRASGPKRKAVLLFDWKGGRGELAEIALGAVPEDRRVWYLDPANPEFGINLLGIPAAAGVRAGLLIDVIREAFGESSVGARSEDLLRQSTQAVCRTHEWLRACGGADALAKLRLPVEPSLHEVLWMLDAGGEGYRALVNWALAHDPESAFTREFWGPGGRFERMREENKGFLAEAVAAPINKLARFLSDPRLARLIGHPVQVSIEQIIGDGDVLIVNANAPEIGKENVKLLAQMLVQLTHRALLTQRELPTRDRRQVAVHIDEAHRSMTETLALMAAEDRSAGLELGLAYQYGEQIVDQIVRSGVRSLCHSCFVFRLRELEDARQNAGVLMELYQDMINANEENQDRLRFSVDDILRIPARKCIAAISAHGSIQPALVASTLPMEDLSDERRAAHHLTAQRKRGCRPLGKPPYASLPAAAQILKLGRSPSPSQNGNGKPRIRVLDEQTPPGQVEYPDVVEPVPAVVPQASLFEEEL